MEAFELAVKLGANGLETDAWLTADGCAVLDHDGVHKGKVRRQPIRRVKRKELGQHIPDFRQLLDMADGVHHVSVDVKDFDCLDELMSTAASSGFPLAKLWLCHYDISHVLEMKRRYPEVRIVDSTRLSKVKEGLERRAALLAEHQIDALNMHVSDWSGGLVTLVHRFNLLAFGWDAQFPNILETALRMGLDAVYSDHVDRMVDAYEKVIGVIPPT